MKNDLATFQYVVGRGIVPKILAEPSQSEPSQRLRINVLFTDLSTAEAALRRAVELAIDLGAETRVIVPHVVPFALPLEFPTVSLEFMRRQLTILAGSVGADPYVNIYLCRDVIDLITTLLPAGSIVVLRARRFLCFSTRATRIARRLRKKGFAVVAV
jgi:hypothetical protein